MNAASKTQPRADWHRADIKAALEKKGYTFARIAREYGYVDNSPNAVLWRSWSHIERIVGTILGVRPADIWPSRYDRRGKPLNERTARARTRNNKVAKHGSVSND
jgi:Ner family transcriptional regulator